MRKVGIIGVGNVGSHVAHSLLGHGICNHLVLIDTNEQKVLSEKLDLEDSIANSVANFTITLNDYNALKDADIVVISAGQLPSAETSRLIALNDSLKALDDILPKIKASGFSGIYLVITNPCDIITWYVLNKTKSMPHKVIGTGTMLDTARFKRIMGAVLSINPKSINGYVLGEHGDSQVIPWSKISVGATQVDKYAADNNIYINHDEILRQTVNTGYEIVKGKGATYFGIAMSTYNIVKSIFNDEHTVYPVSAALNGEYGIKDICISVPCIIGRDGIKKIIQIDLLPEEKENLLKSVEILKSHAAKLKI